MPSRFPFIPGPRGGSRTADLMVARPDGSLLLARPLRRGEALVVGRHPRNSVVLSDDRISRRHALIFDHGEDWFAVDLDSTAGLTGPEGPVRRHHFDPHDPWVRMGPAVLWVERSGRPAPEVGTTIHPAENRPAAADFESDASAEIPADLLLAHVDPSATEPRVRILDLSGVERVLIGADPTCDLVIGGEDVAKLDCILYREGRHWAVADLTTDRDPGDPAAPKNPCRTRVSGGFQRRIGSSILSAVRPDRLQPEWIRASTIGDGSAIGGLPPGPLEPERNDPSSRSGNRRVA
ncbi:MAG: FHA domain-containing protein [Planctomycetota bacterium]|nr:FHA domain-containing protein [Planctomycetota bacterium]